MNNSSAWVGTSLNFCRRFLYFWISCKKISVFSSRAILFRVVASLFRLKVVELFERRGFPEGVMQGGLFFA